MPINRIVKKETQTENPMRNHEGYYDPTPYMALKNIDNEHDRFKNLIGCILRIIEIAGFQLEGRIVLIDKKTGRTWR